MRRSLVIASFYCLLSTSLFSAVCEYGNCYDGYGIMRFDAGWRLKGKWESGSPDGRMIQINRNGSKMYRYWADGEEITAEVIRCKKAKTTVNAYKGFVAVLNGIVAIANDRPIAESAAWGYDAAGKQAIPRAVRMYCE